MNRPVSTLFLIVASLLLLCLVPAPLEAKKEKKPTVQLYAPTPLQPYPHQWIETKTKKGVSVVGQAYRARKDLVVLEMVPLSDSGKPVEIKSIRIRTASGKVYEGKIRRLPSGFMPIARQNYQHPEDGAGAPERAGSPSEVR